MIKILFLAANPTDSLPLRLDEESRAIDVALQQVGLRDEFTIFQHWAVQVDDLQRLLLRHAPNIVHFAGHGSADSELVLVNKDGDSQTVSEESLKRLFSLLKDNIKCVVLNACYSDAQAKAIAQEIDCVIGIHKEISDTSAIKFTSAFYQGLGFGKSVQTAFDLGCLQIELENRGEHERPQLCASRVDPSNIFLTKDDDFPNVEETVSHGKQLQVGQRSSRLVNSATKDWDSSQETQNITDSTVTIGNRAITATQGSVAVSGDVDGDLTISIGGAEGSISWLTTIALRTLMVGIAMLLAIQGFNLYSALSSVSIGPMTGDFNVAIAQFKVVGIGEHLSTAQELSQGFANSVELIASDLQTEFHEKFEVRFPKDIPVIEGGNESEQAENARQVAQSLNADVIVYGTIDVENGFAVITPVFIVNENRNAEFTQASETVGQYRMGSPISLEKLDNRRRRNEVEIILQDRLRALTYIIAGLSDFTVGEYEDAEGRFNQALDVAAWDTPDVIYVMLGNAVLEQRKLQQAAEYYKLAISQNPQYSRAYIGLGVALYAQAIPTDVNADYTQVRIDLLIQSIDSFQKALNPDFEQPPFANVQSKANFHMGQALLAKSLAEMSQGEVETGQQDLYSAVRSFQAVIDDYNVSKHELQQDLAANAHARLGLVYRILLQPESAINEYQQALSLLPKLERTRLERAKYEAAIGEIYLKLDRTVEAKKWYQMALDDAPPDANERNLYAQSLQALER